MYTGIIVADTILSLAFSEKIDVTPMKLQKLTYCVYKDQLKRYGIRLFEEKFEKWKYGPVLCSVYHAYNNYGAKPITHYAGPSVTIIDLSYSSKESESFFYVWNRFKHYSALELSDFTHMPGTAWQKASRYLKEEDIINEQEYPERILSKHYRIQYKQ